MQPLLDYASIIVASAGCILALKSDMSTGKIPNGLTNNMLAASLILALFRAFSGDAAFLYLYVLNFVSGFLIGFIFWHIQAWSGGDAKIFWALASLIPAYPAALGEIFRIQQPYYSQYVFAITILFNLVLILLLRFLILGILKFLKEGRIRELLHLLSSPLLYVLSSTLIGTGLAAITGINALVYISLPTIILLSYVERRSYKRFFVSCMLMIVIGFIASNGASFSSFSSLILAQKQALVMAVLLSAYAAGSRIPFTKTVEIKDLKTGMAVAEEVCVENGSLTRRDVNPSLLYPILSFFSARPEYVIRPSPIGLTENDIRALQKREKDLKGILKINQSFILMPYITAALFMSFYADFLWLLLS